jgi:hypothetical protein
MSDKNYVELGLETIVNSGMCTEEQTSFLHDETMHNVFQTRYEHYVGLFVECCGNEGEVFDYISDLSDEDECDAAAEAVSVSKSFDFAVVLASDIIEIKRDLSKDSTISTLLIYARKKMILEKAIENLINEIKELA